MPEWPEREIVPMFATFASFKNSLVGLHLDANRRKPAQGYKRDPGPRFAFPSKVERIWGSVVLRRHRRAAMETASSPHLNHFENLTLPHHRQSPILGMYKRRALPV
jgi:hypothetical protein